VNPVVAVILGWLIGGEAISVRMVIAAVIIVAGVAIITAAEGRAAPTTDATPQLTPNVARNEA
jgi:drug/metabolite transporter (DMT)-like permease